MKKFTLLLIFMMIAFPTQAKIVGTVISQELTDDGFIKVSTRFIDDKNTVDKADDEQVGAVDHRLWNPLHFQGKTQQEIEAKIQADLQNKAKGNTIYQYMKEKGGNPLDLMRKQVAPTVFSELLNIKINVEQTNLTTKFDIDGDGLCEEEWTINPDGTESKSSINPQSCK